MLPAPAPTACVPARALRLTDCTIFAARPKHHTSSLVLFLLSSSHSSALYSHSIFSSIAFVSNLFFFLFSSASPIALFLAADALLVFNLTAFLSTARPYTPNMPVLDQYHPCSQSGYLQHSPQPRQSPHLRHSRRSFSLQLPANTPSPQPPVRRLASRRTSIATPRPTHNIFPDTPDSTKLQPPHFLLRDLDQ